MIIARLSCAIVLSLAVWGTYACAAEPVSAPTPNQPQTQPPTQAPTATHSTLGLDSLIAKAVRNHPSIAAARAELGATQAEVAAARGEYWPTPSAQVLQDKGNTVTVLTVQQPLWAGGRLDAGLALAKSRADASRVSITDAQYTLALQVVSAWATWKQAHGRAKALTEGVDLLKVYVESMNRRIQGGVSAEVDRELVMARLAQTQSDLAAAQSTERSARARLSQMIGQPLRAEDMAEGMTNRPEPAIETSLPTQDTLIAQALARSAAIKRLEANIEAARHETDKKRAAQWPTLNLRAQHQHGNSTSTGIPANDSSVMLILEYAPGAGAVLSSGANIEAALARLNGLRENLEAARRELTDTVGTDYEEHRASIDRQRELQRTVQASAAVLASYDRLFVAGRRGWLDVINAARELIAARTALADVDAQRIAARTRLRLHAGELRSEAAR